ncbi:hypothetical protein J132_10326, partial [Termitomyces sp. J132]
LKATHDNLGHRGLFATCSALLEQFWWPQVSTDIVWYFWTCHLCQIHQTTKVLIPPTVATPVPLFSKIYMDTMFMPPSNNAATYSVFWSERVTIHKGMGCSPYFVTTGTHPLLPADIVEATYLQPPPNLLLSTTDLIACQAIDLQCCQEDLDCLHSHVLSACRLAAICFETEHATTICNYNFKAGNCQVLLTTGAQCHDPLPRHCSQPLPISHLTPLNPTHTFAPTLDNSDASPANPNGNSNTLSVAINTPPETFPHRSWPRHTFLTPYPSLPNLFWSIMTSLEWPCPQLIPSEYRRSPTLDCTRHLSTPHSSVNSRHHICRPPRYPVVSI